MQHIMKFKETMEIPIKLVRNISSFPYIIVILVISLLYLLKQNSNNCHVPTVFPSYIIQCDVRKYILQKLQILTALQ